MRKTTPPVFYSNQVDEDGRPRKHIRVPDDFIQYLDERIKKIIIEEFKHSGLPEEEKNRQKLFGFLESIRNCWGIVLRSLLGLGAVSTIGWIVYMIRVTEK